MKAGSKSNIYRLAVGIITVSMVLLWGINFYYGFTEKEAIIRKEKDYLYRMCQVTSEQTAGIIGEVKLYMKMLDIWLQDNPKADPRTSPDFIRLVNNVRNESGNRIDLRLVSRSGGLFYIPSQSDKPLSDVSDREYFRVQQNEKTKGFYIAESVKSRVTQLWGIPISYPLTAQNYGISVIFLALELPRLNTLYEASRPKPNGSISLIRTDGILLDRVPFDEKFIGQSMKGGNIWDHEITRLKNGTSIAVANKTDYTKKIIAYMTLDNLPLVVTVSSGYDDVLHNWNTAMFYRILILSVITVIIAVLAWKLRSLFRDLSNSYIRHESLNISLEKSMIQLKKELEEKELVILEVNHRIKNNMAQLISLINISKNMETVKILDLLKSRIYSFSVLYEKLCYSEKVKGEINTAEYIEDLMNKILAIHQENLNIQSRLDLESFYTDSRKIIVIGLILSELIANSIKYAFSDQRENRIDIKMNSQKGRVRFIYQDNGEGFDYHQMMENKQTGHIGFILIHTMIQQFDGSLEYSNEHGSCFDMIL